MKRNMELCRTILLALEDGDGSTDSDSLIGEEFSEQEVRYHAWLLIDAGLGEGADYTCEDGLGKQGLLTNLNWRAHDFLATAKDETRWRQAMNWVKKTTGEVTLAALQT